MKQTNSGLKDEDQYAREKATELIAKLNLTPIGEVCLTEPDPIWQRLVQWTWSKLASHTSKSASFGFLYGYLINIFHHGESNEKVCSFIADLDYDGIECCPF